MTNAVRIPAITLHQPIPSIIAIGAKAFLTRSQEPPRRIIGKRIAIHAAISSTVLEIVASLQSFRAGELRDLLEEAGLANASSFPLGAVICTAIVTAAHLCGHMNPGRQVYVERSIGGVDKPLLIDADPFGDFSSGRWAWQLDAVETLPKPIPAVGHQGIWNWTPPPRHLPASGGHPAILQE